MNELLKYAFEVMNFRRVQFSADIENTRSQNAIKKLGATEEGIFRANYIDSSGLSRDDVYFSIIYTE
ncbi:GNAT family N-acetyltransferase [Lysinibacillus sp. NPDC097231]|uniref:GNAT family N-acetyltransferase n=1 Tax=Lysinibacillus sp. NPDC097231 TaxID=3364142 RepID=UPI0037F6FD02